MTNLDVLPNFTGAEEARISVWNLHEKRTSTKMVGECILLSTNETRNSSPQIKSNNFDGTQTWSKKFDFVV